MGSYKGIFVYKINKKEYEILYMIYFYGYNSASIAKITNKTRQAINQTKKGR